MRSRSGMILVAPNLRMKKLLVGKVICWMVLPVAIFFSTSIMPDSHRILASTGSTQTDQGIKLTNSREVTSDDMPSLSEFIAAVRNGEENEVSGVYVPGLFALPVVQQPVGDFGFVSSIPRSLTKFQLADENHVIGLLAHNYLSGKNFFAIAEGYPVIIVHGDGTSRIYTVTGAHRFRKLDPLGGASDYIDLSTGKKLTISEVFNRFYRGEHHVTFQTCIEREGNPFWGLLFVVAAPIDHPQ